MKYLITILTFLLFVAGCNSPKSSPNSEGFFERLQRALATPTPTQYYLSDKERFNRMQQEMERMQQWQFRDQMQRYMNRHP